MKTIALKERTFNLLNEMKKRKRSESFDELVLELVFEKENVPDSMFGSLKGKTGGFSSSERRRIWRDENRQ